MCIVINSMHFYNCFQKSERRISLLFGMFFLLTGVGISGIIQTWVCRRMGFTKWTKSSLSTGRALFWDAKFFNTNMSLALFSYFCHIKAVLFIFHLGLQQAILTFRKIEWRNMQNPRVAFSCHLNSLLFLNNQLCDLSKTDYH